MNSLKNTKPLCHIFTETDKVFSTDLTATNGHYQQQVTIASEAESRSFFCINPVRGKRRRKDELASYRNFLFESDTMPLSEQFLLSEKLKESGLISMATYSGGKSVHFIISCLDTLNFGEPGSDEATNAYHRTWQGLKSILEKFGLTDIDPSGKNPATLSRMPGHMRGDKKQDLLFLGPLQTAEFLHSITVPAKQKEISPLSHVNSVSELEQVLENPKHTKLMWALKYPDKYLSHNNGNYPLLFRYAAWIFDETNAPLETTISFFKKHWETKLQQKNYFKDWKKPIVDAYRHKGVY